MKSDPIAERSIDEQMQNPTTPRRMSYDERVAKELAERDRLFIVESPPQDAYIFDPWLSRKTMKRWDPDIPFEDPPRFSLARVLAIALICTLLAVAGILAWHVAYAAPIDTPVQVMATVTAYTSSIDETDSSPYTTASGTTTHPGTLACPPSLPFGTHVEISGRAYTCEDRMAARYSDRYDVWMASKDAARAFGIQRAIVSIAN